MKGLTKDGIKTALILVIVVAITFYFFWLTLSGGLGF